MRDHELKYSRQTVRSKAHRANNRDLLGMESLNELRRSRFDLDNWTPERKLHQMKDLDFKSLQVVNLN